MYFPKRYKLQNKNIFQTFPPEVRVEKITKIMDFLAPKNVYFFLNHPKYCVNP